MDFEWDAGNLNHVIRHRVTPQEVEEAMGDPERRAGAAYLKEGEVRQAIIGLTRGSRLLVVVFTHRGNRVRTVTAWPASPRDLGRYQEAKG
ncbi:MAG: BrnT family toxin [Dehalococcoidia bacterium]